MNPAIDRKVVKIAVWLLAIFSIVSFKTVAQDQDQQLFYLTLDTPPAPVLSPAEALATFRIADGFRLELVAAEPLVEDPVAINWDEDGRLYVVEMRGFMQDSYGNGEDEPVGSIVRLTDDNADGIMDRREVMLDSLVLPRAIAILPQGLLVAEPPNLWLCPSELNNAGSIDCSQKRSLGNYGDQPGSVEHAENALLLAMDNWIYNAKSDRKFQIRDSELVVEPTVFRGQWGLTQDDDGYLYYNGNSNLITGDLYADADAIKAGVLPTPGLSQRLHRNDEVFSIRVNPGVNRAYLDGVLRGDGRLRSPTAASGVEIYRGHQFPSVFYGNAFVPESAGNLVAQLRVNKTDLDLQTEHISYPDTQWQQRDFLASTDERFRPVQTQTGPDGALYVVDMYRGIIQDHIFLTDQLREQALARDLERPLGMGRIWRVVHSDNPIDHAPPQLSSATTQELIALLSHNNGWWRQTAQRMLVGSAEQNLRDSLQSTLNGDNHNAAIHSLWIMAGRTELDRELVLNFLDRGVDRFSLHALRAGCDLLQQQDLLSRLEDSSNMSANNRQAYLFCLGRHFSDEAFNYLLAEADDLIANPYFRVALQSASKGREVDLLERLIAQSAESGENDRAAAVEANRREFFPLLARQALTGTERDPQALSRLLDLIADSTGPDWHQDSLLEGIYAASHGNDFDRAVLVGSHRLFDLDGASVRLPEIQFAIADARAAFTWPGDDVAAGQKPLDSKSMRLMALGRELYTAQCASCHGADAAGSVGIAPSLQQSSRILQAPEQLIRIILHGLSGPIEVSGQQWNSVMPGMAHLPQFNDEGISGLVTWLRRSFGHSRGPIPAATVTDIRRQNVSRQNPWTDAELAEVETNRHYEAFTGRYGSYQFRYNGRELEVIMSLASGPLEEIGEDVFYFEPRNFRFEFERVVEGRSPALWNQSDSGKFRIPRAEN